MRPLSVKIFTPAESKARQAHKTWVNHFNKRIYDICKDADIAAELADAEEKHCLRTGIDWGFYAGIDRRLGFKEPKKK